MKISKHLLLAVTAIFSLFLANAQTADEIISKHIQAIGGKEKVNSVTSVKIDNTMQVMGNDAPSTTTLLVGKGYRSESEFNGQKIIQVVTDKGGWAVNPMAGGTEPTPISDEQYKAVKDQLYFAPLVDYASRGSKVELAGKEKVDNADAYKLILTNKDNISTTYYVDANTYYIDKAVRKSNMNGQETELTITFSDYKKSDYGVTVPYSTGIDFGGQFSLTSKVNKIEFNQQVDPTMFEMKK